MGIDSGDESNQAFCSWARAQNQFSSLSVGTTRTTQHCQMLVIHPALNVIITDILPRDPKGRLLVELPLVSLWAISLPRTMACPRTQFSPTVRRLEIPFNAFWHCRTNGDNVLAA